MIAVHATAAVVAAVIGAVVLATPKGTGWHRRLGWSYAATMTVMAVSSFGVYELRDGPSIFHAISIVVLAVVAVGLAQPVRRRSTRWRLRHLVLMQFSYLMLIVTGVAQFFDDLPLPNDALNAVVFLQIPMILGVVAIVRTARREDARQAGRA